MLADTLIHDYAMLIGAVAGLVIAVPLAIVLMRRQTKSVTATFGEMSVKLDQVQGTVDKVNTAVNNVPEGHPTLIERVALVEDGHRWTQDALVRIAQQVGVSLPQPPRPRWFQ